MFGNSADTLKLKIDKSFILYAYIFLLLPIIIFMCSWTKLYIGIPVSAAALAGFAVIYRVKRNYRNALGDKYRKKLLIIAAAALVWTLLAGQGGLFYQNIDFHMRNAIYTDLVNFDWPAIFNIPQNITDGLLPGSLPYENAQLYAGKTVTIVYYLGFWLPPALLGKLATALFGMGAGMVFAQIFLFLWTFSGVASVLYLFCRAFEKFSYKILLVFIFFGGMDIIAAAFYYTVGLQGLLLWFDGRIIPHLDGWTMQQYSSNTTCLFWVFNQALPVWLLCCLMLNEKSMKYLLLPFFCLGISSTMPMIGLVPIFIYFMVKQYMASHKAEGGGYDFSLKSVSREIASYANLPNLAGFVIFIITFLYLSSSPHSESFSFMTGKPDLVKLGVILISLILEVGVLILLLFIINKKKDKQLLILISVLLVMIPFFNLGTRYDFTMRASMPSLFFLCYLTVKTLQSSENLQLNTLLFAVLIIGSFTAFAEILQPIAFLFTGQYPAADNIKSLSDVTNIHFDPSNCLGELHSFFMRYILRT